MSRYKKCVINAGKSDQTASLLKKRPRIKPAWRLSLEARYALREEREQSGDIAAEHARA